MNYTLSLKKMLWRPEEKKVKKKIRILNFFNVAVKFTLKEKNTVPSHIILPTFNTDLRIWYPFVSWDLQKWQKKCAKCLKINFFDTLHN